jgi:arsenate reductase
MTLRLYQAHGILAQSNKMVNVQIFGVKNSQATRAAERFFKERRIAIHMVDLKKKPMAPGEIKRFIDRFGLLPLLDAEGAPYVDAGLKYLRMSDTELLRRIEDEPRLLRLPLVRGGNRLSVGHDEEGWKSMLTGN